MNDDPTLTALRHRLTEVRDSLGDVHMTIPASEIFARDRGRRARHRLAAAAGAAAAVAAVLGTAVALTIGSAPTALATVTSALTRTLNQSYHLTEQNGGYYIRNGRITDRYHETCTTKADPVRHLQASSCSNPAGPDGGENREVGRYTYLYFTAPVDHPGKHWERIPTACEVGVAINGKRLADLSTIAINGFTIATPQQMLSAIKEAAKVTVVGPASGPGWTGTRYAFNKAAQGVRISGTVDVDQQGRARSLVLTIRFGHEPALVFVETQALTFSDFGARVTVTPPPADQTWPSPWPCG